jgi:hypothetical protein
MEKGNFIYQMVQFMKENFKIITSVEKEFTYGLMVINLYIYIYK